MKFKLAFFTSIALFACSLASAQLPAGNASLKPNEQKEAYELCRQAASTEAKMIRQESAGKSADEIKMADTLATMQEMPSICGANGHAPTYWRCVIDRQERNERQGYAMQQCKD